MGSIFVPHPPNQQGRELRVISNTISFQQLIDTLGEVQGVKYQCSYRNLEEAEAEVVKARKRGDEEMEVVWSSKLLPSSGWGVVAPPLDNDKFPFVPEDFKATLQRTYGSK